MLTRRLWTPRLFVHDDDRVRQKDFSEPIRKRNMLHRILGHAVKQHTASERQAAPTITTVAHGRHFGSASVVRWIEHVSDGSN